MLDDIYIYIYTWLYIYIYGYRRCWDNLIMIIANYRACIRGHIMSYPNHGGQLKDFQDLLLAKRNGWFISSDEQKWFLAALCRIEGSTRITNFSLCMDTSQWKLIEKCICICLHIDIRVYAYCMCNTMYIYIYT